MKKYLLLLLLIVNLQVLMTNRGVEIGIQTVSAQMYNVECREVVVTPEKEDCPYCGKTFLKIKIDAHYEECPEMNIECEKCGETMQRKNAECHHCREDREFSNEESSDGITAQSGGGGNEWCMKQLQEIFDEMNKSPKAGYGTYIPTWTQRIIKNVWIPETFPKQDTDNDCFTTSLSYPELCYNPNMTKIEYYEFRWSIEECFNDIAKRPIFIAGAFPNEVEMVLSYYGHEQIKYEQIMNELESDNFVFASIATGYYDTQKIWHYYDDYDASCIRANCHSVVICGYDPVFQEYICMDPWYGQIKSYKMTSFRRANVLFPIARY